MPYEIKKVGFNKYSVYNTITGKEYSKGTTKKKTGAQLKILNRTKENIMAFTEKQQKRNREIFLDVWYEWYKKHFARYYKKYNKDGKRMIEALKMEEGVQSEMFQSIMDEVKRRGKIRL